jgi:hypothetical protein
MKVVQKEGMKESQVNNLLRLPMCSRVAVGFLPARLLLLEHRLDELLVVEPATRGTGLLAELLDLVSVEGLGAVSDQNILHEVSRNISVVLHVETSESLLDCVHAMSSVPLCSTIRDEVVRRHHAAGLAHSRDFAVGRILSQRSKQSSYCLG